MHSEDAPARVLVAAYGLVDESEPAREGLISGIEADLKPDS